MTITDIDLPPAEPVSLDEAKTFLRVDDDAEDRLIANLITHARLRVEQRIEGALMTRRQRYVTDSLSESGFFIHHGPVRAVHTVSMVTGDGEIIALEAEEYTVNLQAVPVMVNFVPAYRGACAQAVSAIAEIDAGYGRADDIPMPLRQAVFLLLAHHYTHRGAAQAPPISVMVDAILMPYRRLKL